MRVREWDPATASKQQIESWRHTLNEVLDADIPEEPRWRPDHIREYLTVTMPDEQRVNWVAEDGDRTLGFASLLLLGAENTCVLELFVRPSARRNGVGSALLAAAAHYAAADGRRALTTEVVAETPSVSFCERIGFQRALTEERHLLDLAEVDWTRVQELAKRVGSGYHIEYHPAGPPDPMLGAYAVAKTVLHGMPTDRVDSRVATAEADRIRASLATLQARGMLPYVVLAVHTTSGAVAGLTELVVPIQHPERADQYDTLVVPAHRGYGLGLAMKSRMLLGLRADETQVEQVQTWHEMENEPMVRVNAVLGFHRDREWYEYEADLPGLVARLTS